MSSPSNGTPPDKDTTAQSRERLKEMENAMKPPGDNDLSVQGGFEDNDPIIEDLNKNGDLENAVATLDDETLPQTEDDKGDETKTAYQNRIKGYT